VCNVVFVCKSLTNVSSHGPLNRLFVHGIYETTCVIYCICSQGRRKVLKFGRDKVSNLKNLGKSLVIRSKHSIYFPGDNRLQ
jgi:hypothetical protein